MTQIFVDFLFLNFLQIITIFLNNGFLYISFTVWMLFRNNTLPQFAKIVLYRLYSLLNINQWLCFSIYKIVSYDEHQAGIFISQIAFNWDEKQSATTLLKGWSTFAYKYSHALIFGISIFLINLLQSIQLNSLFAFSLYIIYAILEYISQFFFAHNGQSL